ncbi:MAG TPA: SRPBCC domain-containing protein, partial [Chromatiales bacterium]|nr:SRPBCC domain-containing protein [Chromatiales bacterium]
MSRWIESAVRIDAPAHRVWGILLDTARYPDWNPFLRRVEGELQPGARLNVAVDLPRLGPRRFRPTVLAVLPERELRWLGRLRLPGVFDGEHRFRLEESGEGGVR